MNIGNSTNKISSTENSARGEELTPAFAQNGKLNSTADSSAPSYVSQVDKLIEQFLKKNGIKAAQLFPSNGSPGNNKTESSNASTDMEDSRWRRALTQDFASKRNLLRENNTEAAPSTRESPTNNETESSDANTDKEDSECEEGLTPTFAHNRELNSAADSFRESPGNDKTESSNDSTNKALSMENSEWGGELTRNFASRRNFLRENNTQAALSGNDKTESSNASIDKSIEEKTKEVREKVTQFNIKHNVQWIEPSQKASRSRHSKLEQLRIENPARASSKASSQVASFVAQDRLTGVERPMSKQIRNTIQQVSKSQEVPARALKPADS